MNIHRTRIKGLGYCAAMPGAWRFVDIHDGVTHPPRLVGPSYPTKTELLSDFERYARESWGYGEQNGGLMDYMVMVQEGDDGDDDVGYWSFHCQAENAEHAREQALGHSDSIKVLSVWLKAD